MTHTLPDYSTKYKLAKIFSQVDNAELAARLGALSLLDRRGNIVWYDDFEAAAAVKWIMGATAAGTTVLSTDRSYMGNQSMKTVTDVNIADNCWIAKVFSLPIERIMAVEFMFHVSGGKPSILLMIAGYTGTTLFGAQVKYDINAGKLYYLDSVAGWTELTNVDYVLNVVEGWSLVKLVINWETKEYIRLIFCGTEYDLRGHYIPSGGSISKRYISVNISSTAMTAAAATAYFDNVILTQNE